MSLVKICAVQARFHFGLSYVRSYVVGVNVPPVHATGSAPLEFVFIDILPCTRRSRNHDFDKALAREECFIYCLL